MTPHGCGTTNLLWEVEWSQVDCRETLCEAREGLAVLRPIQPHAAVLCVMPLCSASCLVVAASCLVVAASCSVTFAERQ